MSDFERTVAEPIHIAEDAPSVLSDFEEVRLWGTTESESTKKRSAFEQMNSGNLILFSHEGEFFAAGRVGRTLRSSDVGEWVWSNEESSWVYTVTDYEEVTIEEGELYELLEYSDNFYLQGFTRVSDSAIDALLQQCPSVEEAFQDLKNTSEEETSDSDIRGKGEEDGPREHTEIQWKLIQLGLDHGYDVYVAKNDRNRVYKGQRLGDRCVEQLSLTGFSDAAISIIEYIDVIWLKGNYIAQMFEVESTTSIYSGILRMSDFVVRVPNLSIDMYIVAPKESEEKVRKQINRPTFERVLGQADHCSLEYLPFDRVRDRYDLVQGAGPLQTVF
jgi:hypothetical protein